MIWTMVAILLFLAVPALTFQNGGGIIHLLLLMGVVVLIFKLMTGRLIA